MTSQSPPALRQRPCRNCFDSRYARESRDYPDAFVSGRMDGQQRLQLLGAGSWPAARFSAAAWHPSALHQMLVTMIEVGLFDFVKTIEIIGGLCLIFGVFVPLATLVLLPVSAIVFYNAIFLNLRTDRLLDVTYMGVSCLYMNVIIALAYVRHYLPLLSLRSTPGGLGDLAELPKIFRRQDNNHAPLRKTRGLWGRMGVTQNKTMDDIITWIPPVFRRASAVFRWALYPDRLRSRNSGDRRRMGFGERGDRAGPGGQIHGVRVRHHAADEPLRAAGADPGNARHGEHLLAEHVHRCHAAPAVHRAAGTVPERRAPAGLQRLPWCRVEAPAGAAVAVDSGRAYKDNYAEQVRAEGGL